MIKLIKNAYIWGIYTARLYLKINLLKKTINPLSNKFATVVKIKVTGELKLNDSPGELPI